MNNLLYAIKAFWTILFHGTHVYCDLKGRSMNGRAIHVKQCLIKLSRECEEEIKKERLLQEAKRLISQDDA